VSLEYLLYTYYALGCVRVLGIYRLGVGGWVFRLGQPRNDEVAEGDSTTSSSRFRIGAVLRERREGGVCPRATLPAPSAHPNRRFGSLRPQTVKLSP
jgi:hypothetical protein